jgi:hypothetical protein
VGAPEKIVGEFFFVRLLESEHRRSLRVHAAEHVPHDAILAGGVQRLQYDEKGLGAVRVERRMSRTKRRTASYRRKPQSPLDQPLTCVSELREVR